jgi:hypothetical protein
MYARTRVIATAVLASLILFASAAHIPGVSSTIFMVGLLVIYSATGFFCARSGRLLTAAFAGALVGALFGLLLMIVMWGGLLMLPDTLFGEISRNEMLLVPMIINVVAGFLCGAVGALARWITSPGAS